MWLATGTLLLGVVLLCELAGRCWVRFRSAHYVSMPGLRRRHLIDRGTLPALESEALLEINNDGERGALVPRVRCLYRVLVAGGSSAECHYNDQSKTWSGRLQALLSEPSALSMLRVDAVHVGNVAKPGIDARALEQILNGILPRYSRLNLIVLMVGASDVLRWLEAGAPASGPPPPVPLDACFEVHPNIAFGWSPRRLAGAHLLRRAIARWARPIETVEHAGAWLASAREARQLAREVLTRTPDASPVVDAFGFHLRRAIQVARGHADEVIVVRQPWFEKRPFLPEEETLLWNGSVGNFFREPVLTRFFSNDVIFDIMAQIDAKTASIAESSSVTSIDLRSSIEMSTRTYYDHFHFTSAGADEVARVIAGVVLAANAPVGAGIQAS